VRARHVASKAVADHDRILRFEVERRECGFEDLRLGFSDAELGGNDRDLERRRERRVRELLPLDVGCAVGHERQSMV